MNNTSKSESPNTGLKRRIFRKPSGLSPIDTTNDLSVRPTKSFSGIKSLIPTKVAPKSLLGNIKKD